MTFGKAWGQDGQPYGGKDFRALAASLSPFGGIMAPGHLAVSAQSTPDATARIAAGRALVPATGAGLGFTYHVWNDGFVNTPAFTATGAQARTDRVILRVDASGNVNPEIVLGTPGPGTPAPPTVTGNNFITLARVEIPASTSTITNGMIIQETTSVPVATTRVASSLVPFLTPAPGDTNWEPDTGRFELYNGTEWIILSEPEAAYTPNCTAAGGGFALSNGTLVGRKARLAHKLCRVQIDFTSGSSTNGGSGDISFSLPHPARTGVPEQQVQARCFVPGVGLFDGHASIPADGRLHPTFPASAGQSNVGNYRNWDGATTGTGIPAVAGGFTLASGARCIIDGTYELA